MYVLAQIRVTSRQTEFWKRESSSWQVGEFFDECPNLRCAALSSERRSAASVSKQVFSVLLRYARVPYRKSFSRLRGGLRRRS
jgi:hypothetical protein